MIRESRLSALPLPGRASVVDALLDGALRARLPFAARPPVIVIGMHRSGTSLIAGMLARLGVYMGPIQLPAGNGERNEGLFTSGYAEAEELHVLNEQLLSRAGGSWCAPAPFLKRRGEDEFARQGQRTLRTALLGGTGGSYARGVRGGVTAWGWKDPRTSLTLPFWLHLFPDALIVHVRRNPEDAARSLHRRAIRWNNAEPVQLTRGERLRWALGHPLQAAQAVARKLRRTPAPVAPPDPCLDLGYCEELGQTYLQECLRFRGAGGGMLEVWYEEALEEPLRVSRRLACFSGFDPERPETRKAAALVQPRRARVPLLRVSPGGYYPAPDEAAPV